MKNILKIGLILVVAFLSACTSEFEDGGNRAFTEPDPNDNGIPMINLIIRVYDITDSTRVQNAELADNDVKFGETGQGFAVRYTTEADSQMHTISSDAYGYKLGSVEVDFSFSQDVNIYLQPEDAFFQIGVNPAPSDAVTEVCSWNSGSPVKIGQPLEGRGNLMLNGAGWYLLKANKDGYTSISELRYVDKNGSFNPKLEEEPFWGDAPGTVLFYGDTTNTFGTLYKLENGQRVEVANVVLRWLTSITLPKGSYEVGVVGNEVFPFPVNSGMETLLKIKLNSSERTIGVNPDPEDAVTTAYSWNSGDPMQLGQPLNGRGNFTFQGDQWVLFKTHKDGYLSTSELRYVDKNGSINPKLEEKPFWGTIPGTVLFHIADTTVTFEGLYRYEDGQRVAASDVTLRWLRSIKLDPGFYELSVSGEVFPFAVSSDLETLVKVVLNSSEVIVGVNPIPLESMTVVCDWNNGDPLPVDSLRGRGNIRLNGVGWYLFKTHKDGYRPSSELRYVEKNGSINPILEKMDPTQGSATFLITPITAFVENRAFRIDGSGQTEVELQDSTLFSQVFDPGTYMIQTVSVGYDTAYALFVIEAGKDTPVEIHLGQAQFSMPGGQFSVLWAGQAIAHNFNTTNRTFTVSPADSGEVFVRLIVTYTPGQIQTESFDVEFLDDKGNVLASATVNDLDDEDSHTREYPALRDVSHVANMPAGTVTMRIKSTSSQSAVVTHVLFFKNTNN